MEYWKPKCIEIDITTTAGGKHKDKTTIKINDSKQTSIMEHAISAQAKIETQIFILHC